MRRVYVDGGEVVQSFLRDGLGDHHRSAANKRARPALDHQPKPWIASLKGWKGAPG